MFRAEARGRPFSPNTSTIRSEKPLMTFGWSPCTVVRVEWWKNEVRVRTLLASWPLEAPTTTLGSAQGSAAP